MQYRFFDIPAADAEQAEADLKRFVRGHRAISVQRELVREAGGAYWTLCVEYLEGVGGSGAGKPGGRPRVRKSSLTESHKERDRREPSMRNAHVVELTSRNWSNAR